MKRPIFLLLFVLSSLALMQHTNAEGYMDFGAENVGRAGTGSTLGRGATGFYYNPANVGARPWEKQDLINVEFDIPSFLTASIQGSDFQFIFDTVDAANELFDQFGNGAFDIASNSLTFQDMAYVFDVFAALDQLDSLNGDGFILGGNVGIGARFNNLWLPRDGLGINISMHTTGAASPVVDLDSLLGFRMTDESGAQFDQLINIAIANSSVSNPTPSTTSGQSFSTQLQGAGYPAVQADALAAQAESSGVNFGGTAGAILFDFLVNTRNGTGQSLESGANPLEGNGSGFLIRGVAFYQMGLSYGFGVTDWISIGGTINLFKATTFSELIVVEDMTSNGVRSSMSRIQDKIKSATRFEGDAEHFNVGFDLGVIFTPTGIGLDGLTLSLSAKNINGPEFHWDKTYPGEPGFVRLDPLARVGAAYTFNRESMPITFVFEADLNSVGSDLLPNYHSQFIRAAVSIEPYSVGFGFRASLGYLQNLADANQAPILAAGLGIRFVFVTLDFGAQAALENRNFGPNNDFEAIPQWLAFSFSLGIRTDF
ncbi:MAG: conjugal transfer protein TraF [Planctomycetota bacterium]